MSSREYYDRLGSAEWERLTSDTRARVALEVHQRFLRQYVRAGDRVLEIGAGPGRFTLELAALGARIVVTDLSPVQLRLNAERVGDIPAVERRELVDVCDTSRYGDGEFDAVVAFGGPLSYAFERTDAALAGLLRVVRSGGPVLASVMSMLGAWRHLLRSISGVAETIGEDANDAVLRSGDLRLAVDPESGQPPAHVCRMFRWREVSELVERVGAEVLGASASNWASMGDPETLAALEADPDRWRRFLDHEVAACAEPGALDGGTHILFACHSQPE